MDFYYPNYQNDMWRIFGLIFFGDMKHLLVENEKRFDIVAIKSMLTEKGVALYDTAAEVIRKKNTASDKDLQIVRQTNINGLLSRLPQCKAVATTGQLATTVVAGSYGVSIPKLGDYVEFNTDGRTLRLYRMPSSSRAYPLPLEKKANLYRKVFDYISECNYSVATIS